MKEVQSLIGKVVALIRFISRAMDKCMPSFKVLKKAFRWTDEVKGVPDEATSTKHLRDEREVVPLLGSI